MAARIIDGKTIAARLREDLAARVADLGTDVGTVGLDVILVGDDPASAVYVRNKRKAADKAGIRCTVHALPEDVSENTLLARIDALNADPACHGIIVQLPLPKHLDEALCVRRVHPDKDVDGFHPHNLGLLMAGTPAFVPCTPLGVMRLLEESGTGIAGRRAVIVGVGNVGKPLAVMLMTARATVTVCNSRTPTLGEVTRQGDILVVAAGRPGLISGDMIRPGATVIDVGINRLADGSLCGDVDFASAREVAGAITPVPGGVGPMTVAMLLTNTVQAATRARGG